MKTLFKDAYLISPDVELEGASVLVEDGKIRHVYANGDKLPEAENVVELQGDMLVPGFIDIHTHGRNGVEFADGTVESMDVFAKGKLEEGVTTLVPSTSTQSEANLSQSLRSAAEYIASGKAALKIPGAHLEGVFINKDCMGAQNPDFLRTPDIEEVKRLNAIFPVKKVSFAIELPGAPEFTADLLELGIVPSCVHSAATYAQFKVAYEHGLRDLTHFCNQMTPLRHREIGLVGAGFMHEDVFVEMICDCIHLCPDMIQLAFSIKDTDHIMLITDSVAAMGMPDGEYCLSGLSIIMKNGEVRLRDNPSALAGSSLAMNVALRNVYEVTGIPLRELIRTTSWNQARNLGLPGIGRIHPGYAADLTVLSGDFDVEQVYVDGVLKYSAE